MTARVDSKPPKIRPWHKTVDTYIWVEDQQRLSRTGWNTAQWVLEQQMRALYGTDANHSHRHREPTRKAEKPHHPPPADYQQHHRRRVSDERREREQKIRVRERAVISWKDYQSRWDAIQKSTHPLSFSDIPWPQTRQPTRAQHISQKEIVAFLRMDPDPADAHRRKRALLLWHPDRFKRTMCRVLEKDKAKVEEAVGIVARVLTSKDVQI